MDNHPIPQDVTGFQFRLIGNMTVKQFGFLAVGGIAAVITYYLPIFILLKVLFVPLFGFTGFAFAFIPLEGRPLDAMLGYFLRALASPNQYVFHKTTGHFSFDNISPAAAPLPVHLPVAVQKKAVLKTDSATKQKQLQTYLQQFGHPATAPTDKKEEKYLSSILSEADLPPVPMTMPVSITPQQHASQPVLVPPPQIQETEPEETPTPPPTPAAPPQTHAASSVDSAQIISMSSGVPFITTDNTEDTLEKKRREKELAEKEEALKKEELEAAKKKEEEEKHLKEEEEKVALMKEAAQKVTQDNQMTHEKLLELEKSFQEMLSQKQSLEQELQKLKTEAAKSPVQQAFVPSKMQEPQKQQTKLVQQVPQDQAAKKGLPPMPDVPNIFLGVIKDSSGNILPNILVEVKDNDGNPVRAFKTNQLGQFASATPLMKGSYTVEFEDTTGKNKFDAVEIEAKGEILLPVEVVSHDLREELRKQLFN